MRRIVSDEIPEANGEESEWKFHYDDAYRTRKEQYALYRQYRSEPWHIESRVGGVPLTREQRILKLEHELEMTGHHPQDCSCRPR